LYVSNRGCIVGPVSAPRIVISGIVFGSVSALEVIVEPGGQIWGDVLAASMELGPGGKLHGWFSALDEGTIDLLRAGDLDRGDLLDPGPGSMRADILARFPEVSLISRDDAEVKEEKLEIWRQLRAEAALATVARAEIEAAFERRVNEAILDFKSEIKKHPAVETSDQQKGIVPSANDAEIVAARQATLVELQKELEEAKADLHRRQVLFNRVIAQAKIFHSRYIWAEANLDSAKKALAEYRGVSAVNLSAFIDIDGSDIASSGEEIALSLARNEQIAELRSQLVERDIEIENIKNKVNALKSELKKTVRIAAQKIRRLESKQLQDK